MKTSYLNLILSILPCGLLYFVIGLFLHHRPFLSNAIESLILGTFAGGVNYCIYHIKKNRVKK